MPKDKLIEYDSNAANNTDCGSVNLAENSMLPSDVNNYAREIMSHLKEFADGTSGINVLSLTDDTDTNQIKIQAPSAVTTTTTFTLPDGDGDAYQVLKTDGSGTLDWVNVAPNPSLIINGAMQVAQRGTNVTGISSGGYRTVDRFAVKESASSIVVTESQSTDTPSGQGFANSLKWEVTTADTSVASAERFHFGQTIEAQDLQHLEYGTSSAKTITLSFWVKSSVAGTYAVSIFKSDQTLRLLNKTYTINTADTWEKKEITIDGDTAGGGIDNDNGAGFQFDWFLTAGSGSTTASTNEWEAWDATKWAGGHNVNFGATVGNEFYITGVKLEVGSTATDFVHRSYGEELALCQRYYYKVDPTGVSGWHSQMIADNTTYRVETMFYPVEMRASGTATTTATTSFTFGSGYPSVAFANKSIAVCRYDLTSTGGWANIATFTVDAEL